MICLDVSQHWLGRGEFERTFHPNPVADKARSDSFYRKSAVFSCHSFGRQSRFDSNPPPHRNSAVAYFSNLWHTLYPCGLVRSSSDNVGSKRLLEGGSSKTAFAIILVVLWVTDETYPRIGWQSNSATADA